MTSVRLVRLVFALAITAVLASCAKERGMAGPSAVIVPDLASIRVGGAQTFVVYNAQVQRFTLRSEGRPHTECVRIDSSAVQGGNAVRLVALASCQGFLYVTADLGSDRSPVVAAVTVE